MSYKVGRGGMLDGLDEALAGMSAGDEKTFTSQLVGGDLVGEDVEVTVEVSQVQEQELPELDDEFAQMASEFDTVDELTADVRERLGRGKRLEQAAAARDAVLEALLEKVEIPLPETMVTDELNARRQNIEQQLAYAGITMDKYLEDEGQTLEEFEADLERRVRDAVAAQFILDEIAKKEEFGVDQNELSQHLVRRAQQSGQDPQEFANHMFEHNHIPELVQEILRGKALATIVESAVVKDASGNVVELKNLRPDGTIGEPEDEAAPRTPPRSCRGRAGRGRRGGARRQGVTRRLPADPSETFGRVSVISGSSVAGMGEEEDLWAVTRLVRGAWVTLCPAGGGGAGAAGRHGRAVTTSRRWPTGWAPTRTRCSDCSGRSPTPT